MHTGIEPIAAPGKIAWAIASPVKLMRRSIKNTPTGAAPKDKAAQGGSQNQGTLFGPITQKLVYFFLPNPKAIIVPWIIGSLDWWIIGERATQNNPLIQQDVVHFPNTPNTTEFDQQEEPNVASESYALGFIETQGFTAVFEAIDTACKAANVEVIGKEKLGGGYVTVVIKGDVAAVNAAIDAGRPKVEALGTLIAAHVIPRPTSSVLGLLPKI